MDMDRFDWLEKRTETAIDADRRIIDPHHHLWDGRGRIADYMSDELRADLTGSHNVVGTVFVECGANFDREAEPHMRPVGETRFVAEHAARLDTLGGPSIAGIVGHADMRRGVAAADVLAAHVEAGAGRFRGIRHLTAWDELLPKGHLNPEPEMMTDPAFHAGVRTLGEMGLTYDAFLYHPQLPEVEALAAAVPGTTIVLDHLGGPLGIGHYGVHREESRVAWRRAMQRVETHPNIVLKVGGIGMDNYYGTGFAALPAPPSSEEVASHWDDDLRWLIDLFGPSRCMFESNFPVDRQTLPYPVLWNAFQIIADRYTNTEQNELFAGTAERVYRLAI